MTQQGHKVTPQAREASIKARKGKRSPAWKGGRHKDRNGYVMVYNPQHQNATAKGYVQEHRMVMSDHIGRPLISKENVHHINGDRSDNKLSNLELWNTMQPSGQRVEEKILFAKEILKIYEQDN